MELAIETKRAQLHQGNRRR